MAYDPVKAHEYYVNYRKKGLKKGRKKSKGTTKATTKNAGFLGVSIAGLNDEGRIQGALIKEKVKKEMNEALQKAATDEEKEKIRLEYSRKAQQQISALKADSKYAKPKKTAGTTTKKAGTTTTTGKSKKTKGIVITSRTKGAKTAAPTISNEVVSSLMSAAENLMGSAGSLPDDAKSRLSDTVRSILDRLKALRGK